MWYSLSQFLLSLSCLVTKVKVLHTRPPYRESGITKLSDKVYADLIFQLALAIRLADVAHEDWDDKISNTDSI